MKYLQKMGLIAPATVKLYMAHADGMCAILKDDSEGLKRAERTGTAIATLVTNTTLTSVEAFGKAIDTRQLARCLTLCESWLHDNGMLTKAEDINPFYLWLANTFVHHGHFKLTVEQTAGLEGDQALSCLQHHSIAKRTSGATDTYRGDKDLLHLGKALLLLCELIPASLSDPKISRFQTALGLFDGICQKYNVKAFLGEEGATRPTGEEHDTPAGSNSAASSRDDGSEVTHSVTTTSALKAISGRVETLQQEVKNLRK